MEENPPLSPESSYDELETWCIDSIASGSDFLFDPILFRRTLLETSIQYTFPVKVRRNEGTKPQKQRQNHIISFPFSVTVFFFKFTFPFFFFL